MSMLHGHTCQICTCKMQKLSQIRVFGIKINHCENWVDTYMYQYIAPYKYEITLSNEHYNKIDSLKDVL